MLTVREGGRGRPAFRAFFRRRHKMSEIVSRGMPSRGLNSCAAMNRKKIIGSQRINAMAVRALVLPATRSAVKLGFSNNLPKLAGPALLAKAKTNAARDSSVQNVQMRAKSSSDKSQRALMKRELSSTTAMMAPSIKNPVCQPQKSSAAASRKRGVFITGTALVQSAPPPACENDRVRRASGRVQRVGWRGGHHNHHQDRD